MGGCKWLSGERAIMIGGVVNFLLDGRICMGGGEAKMLV